MKRYLLACLALLFAVEITIPDAAAGPFGLFNRTFGGSQSACANGQCNAANQTIAEAAPAAASTAASSIAAGKKRLDLSQRIVFNRFERNPDLRRRFAVAWNAKYAEAIDPNNLQDFIKIILEYLPYVLEILLALVT